MRKLRLILLLFLYVSELQAEQQWVVMLGTDFGLGGQLLPDNYRYWDKSSPNIDSGRGAYAGVGALFPLKTLETGQLYIQPMLGYKYMSMSQGIGAYATWTHVPADLMFFYKEHEQAYRLGAGLSYQAFNYLEGTGKALPISANYHNSLGVNIQAEYFIAADFSVSIKYQMIEYRSIRKDYRASGANIGLGFSYFLSWPSIKTRETTDVPL